MEPEAIIALVVSTVALAVTAYQVWLNARSERRRAQPVVIVHQFEEPWLDAARGGWLVYVYLENRG